MSCNKEEQNSFNIDVDITKLVLTPLTCAFLVSKVVKSLIYEKSQIPYPYEWLKNLVNKKRQAELEGNNDEGKNYQARRHFRVVSNAYDTAELLLKQITNQFKTEDNIEEILLMFGGSELCPKEVYRIKIPTLATGHVENNHVSLTNKLSHTVLRKIVLSPEWMSAIDHTLPPTNMFVFLKKSGSKTDALDFFIPNSSFYFPKRTLVVNINLIYTETSTSNCCKNLTVFQEGRQEQSAIKQIIPDKEVHSNDRENLEPEWYQASAVFKGFKEPCINKVPLSQLW